MADVARVALDLGGAVAELRLCAPATGNAIDPAWVAQFVDAVARLEQPGEARAVLISAEGPRFTVGGDLAHFARQTERLAEELDAMVGPFHQALARLGALALPVVCAAQGPVAGGGLGLLWCADEVLLAPDAKLACGFSLLGLSGDGGSSWALPRLVGLRRAQELVMGGRVLSAQEAVDWGLATAVVPADDLAERARARAEHYAAGPTAAYGEMRRLLRAQATWAEQLADEHRTMLRTGATADAREGVTSFAQRRRPQFRGR
ncbi:enoyl-CoA hydratase/isomerase family protein [Conexibacter sp. SYSU D00693]|uniref:enoyl-CoA hydratase/isomerase family protein n=1 Tax=Conexibacter sp. SYSU D00693 TaxID=2812560 RepID=UPI00196AAEFB|nr:enoyl-CoA hydratase-related protein [Conexibacter sp. SYSU D00693]